MPLWFPGFSVPNLREKNRFRLLVSRSRVSPLTPALPPPTSGRMAGVRGTAGSKQVPPGGRLPVQVCRRTAHELSMTEPRAQARGLGVGRGKEAMVAMVKSGVWIGLTLALVG